MDRRGPAPLEDRWHAALARFITECEAAGDFERVVDDVVEALYEFDAHGRSHDDPDGPLHLLTAHRAKGLEFDHVVILDGGGWASAAEDERRLFYVAMTRARASLTLCERIRGRHPFSADLGALALRTRPAAPPTQPRLNERSLVAGADKVYLSWPGKFDPAAPIHAAIARLHAGDPLALQPRRDGQPGWELADASGVTVARMSRSFTPPEGEIVSVAVAAILARDAQPLEAGVRCRRWEVVIPQIDYLPTSRTRRG